MQSQIYRYTFAPSVDRDEVETTVLLTVLATESLHGVQAQLDAAHYLDPDEMTCVVDAGTEVGRDFNRLLIGFLRREFGGDDFKVVRVKATPAQPAA